MKQALLFLFCVTPLFAMTDYMWGAIRNAEVRGEKRIVVVVPTYNNSRWCIENISSILSQKYSNYHVYIIDDCSTDDTFQKITMYLSNHSLRDKVTVRRNASRLGAMANWYNTISELEDYVIVLNVDGDDSLAHTKVLCRINRAYADRRIWMTYGQFKVWPDGYRGFCKRHAPEVILAHAYRQTEWLSSHLRTYYAWLFKKIDIEDFMYDSEFLQATCDRAIMYPLLEMCAGHYRCFNHDVLYIYNAENPLADVRKNGIIQQRMCDYIKKLPAYEPLADVLVRL